MTASSSFRFFGVVAISFLYLTLMSGCRVSGGNTMKPEQIASIQKGKTTEADLIRMFGEPRMRTADSQGNHQLTFMHAERRNPIAGAFYGNYVVTSTSLTVTVGSDGTVKNFTTSDSTVGG